MSTSIQPRVLHLLLVLVVVIDASPTFLPPGDGAVLALPMARGGMLVGLVLLGKRGGGETYRPDEVELLQRAAREAGLDSLLLRANAHGGEGTLDELRLRLDRIEASLPGLALPKSA